MSTITAHAQAELIAALTALGHPKLALRLAQAIDRDRRGGTTIADGWPRGHADGPGNGAHILVLNEHGHEERIQVTAVELAVIARLSKSQPDPLRSLVNLAIRHAVRVVVTNAQRDLVRLENALDGIEHLGHDQADDTTPTDPGCVSCARYHDALSRPLYSPTHRGNLCAWCYGYTLDDPKKRQPPVALIELRARGVKITLNDIARAIAEQTKKRKRKAAPAHPPVIPGPAVCLTSELGAVCA